MQHISADRIVIRFISFYGFRLIIFGVAHFSLLICKTNMWQTKFLLHTKNMVLWGSIRLFAENIWINIVKNGTMYCKVLCFVLYLHRYNL